MSHSAASKEIAVLKYIDTFAQSAKRVRAGGDLFISSCSSHIHFTDFYSILSESLSKAKRKAQVLRGFRPKGLTIPFLMPAQSFATSSLFMLD